MPELSAIIIVGEMRVRAEASLAHLLAQTALDRMEILVVDLTPHLPPLNGADHPTVRCVKDSSLRYFCDAQAEAVLQAQSPLVAFVEDHSYASPGWAAAILRAFENPAVAAVNYTFVSVQSDNYLARAILMAEYGHWMAPHPGGRVAFCSSTNIAYRRDVLLPEVSKGSTVFETEFLIHRMIQASGKEIHVVPEALVGHESWHTLRCACLANGANKRVLGARRAEEGRWGLPKRIAWGCGMALMPFLGLGRLAWALRNRPRLWPLYVAGLPVVATIYAYAYGCEALGYWFGAGASRDEFRDRELAIARNV